MSLAFDQISLLSLTLCVVCLFHSLSSFSLPSIYSLLYKEFLQDIDEPLTSTTRRSFLGYEFRAGVSYTKSKRYFQRGFSEMLKMKKDGDGMKVDLSSAHSGNKVLPVSDQATPSLMSCKKESRKGEIKSKALSKMKELLKWAASPKSDKPSKLVKALHFRNHPSVKAVKDERGGDDGDDEGDEGSIESPKLSLRWDAESCFKISSAFSSVSDLSFEGDNDGANTNIALPRFAASRRANWITTDSDFVVLELLRE